MKILAYHAAAYLLIATVSVSSNSIETIIVFAFLSLITSTVDLQYGVLPAFLVIILLSVLSMLQPQNTSDVA